MNITKAYQHLLQSLHNDYDKNEAEAIARIVFEDLFSISSINLISDAEKSFSENDCEKLENIIKRLQNHEPMQYVTCKSIFCGNEFLINKSVLIPRPETEELVQWIIESTKNIQQKILDIGTGSGCIAVSLKKKIPKANIFATDISNSALEVARENSLRLKAEVEFAQSNILQLQNPFNKKFDVIVSNPPYIAREEAHAMDKNVLQFEPHTALFVEGNDALLFYRKIIAFSLLHLNTNGKLFFEVNQLHAHAVKNLLIENNFSEVEIRKDINGNDRIVSATR